MAKLNVVPIARQPRGEGFYFRVRYNEHQGFSRLLAEGRLTTDGLILDARHHDRHESIRRDVTSSSMATCLDPQGMEIALPAMLSKGHARLPWAAPRLRQPNDFSRRQIERYAERLAKFAVAGGYSSVLAPAHYLGTESVEWLDVDSQLIRAFRSALNSEGGSGMEITYPLAIHTQLFQDKTFRAEAIRVLKSLPIEAVSLRVHPFGHESGPLAIRRFVDASRDLRRVSLPLLIERSGIAGLAAYAIGAVDRVESGVTYGDAFDIGSRLRPASGALKSFTLPRRVYIEAIGASIDIRAATRLLATPNGKLWFACKEHSCCPDGWSSMLANPFRHSALARQRQYTELARMPISLRPNHFIFTTLSGIADMLSRAGKTDNRFKKAHHRLLSIKDTLIDLHHEDSAEQRRMQLLVRQSGRSAGIHPLFPRDRNPQ